MEILLLVAKGRPAEKIGILNRSKTEGTENGKRTPLFSLFKPNRILIFNGLQEFRCVCPEVDPAQKLLIRKIIRGKIMGLGFEQEDTETTEG